ncbi:MAG: 1-deoxy-D-xylulose-5-phosphate reductoisomerase [Clostridia bacterium]|nr:1-deoxy-D-xylulose-5-phosphate reductoisomerase [Clostridia bacterium]
MVNLRPNPAFRANAACVLGATGSVGIQTLDVLAECGIPVEMMTAGEGVERFARAVKRFRPKIAAMTTGEAAAKLRELLGDDAPEILWRPDEVLDAVRTTGADIVFHSVSGLAGLDTAIAAAESGKRVGMANKEAIVACGDLILDRAASSGGEIIPVDSEHCAIYRCLEGRDPGDLRRILLTASGGPFFGRTAEELRHVTAAEALAHPTWKMGKKITVDSATLMNKGFEVIEAVRLFGVPENRVDVLVHRQSIVHSMVEWNDNTLLAQMGRPDMRDCIRYALTAPHAAPVTHPPLDLAAIGSLTFAEPDTTAFPLLEAAREAVRMGGTAPACLIAADEEAVDAFLAGQIGFQDIAAVVTETLGRIPALSEINTETAAYTVTQARRFARRQIDLMQRM